MKIRNLQYIALTFLFIFCITSSSSAAECGLSNELEMKLFGYLDKAINVNEAVLQSLLSDDSNTDATDIPSFIDYNDYESEELYEESDTFVSLDYETDQLTEWISQNPKRIADFSNFYSNLSVENQDLLFSIVEKLVEQGVDENLFFENEQISRDKAKNIPLIIAHRGSSWEAPENTMSAFNIAWNQGAKVVELDIQLSKDNEIVVFHDKTTRRFDGKLRKIRKSTLKQLKKIDIGSYKGEEWKEERIPTLEEVYPTVPEDGTLLIELKCGKEILQPLKQSLQNSGLRNDQILIMTFNTKLVKRTRKMFPDVEVHKLMFLPKISGIWLAKQLVKRDINTVSIRHGNKVSKRFVRILHSLGMKVFVWTVNSVSKAKKLIEIGVDGIITDKPAMLAEEFSF